MKMIPLTRGLFALVDDEDFEFLSQWNWYALTCRDSFYAARNGWTTRGEPRGAVLMHRVLLPGAVQVDHKNRNKLDNQKANLRPATVSTNSQNRPLYRSNTSGYKGVTFHKPTQTWKARISKDGRRWYVGGGYFDSAEEAGRAYDEAAKQLFGEFACLNFP